MAPGRDFAGHAQCGNHRAGIGHTLARNIEGGSMVGAGTHNRQAQRDIDSLIEIERLDRDQRLIVIHAQRRVIAFAGMRSEQRVGGVRAGYSQSLGPKRGDRRSNDCDLLAAHAAFLARVRIECGNRDPGHSNPEIGPERPIHDPRAAHDQLSAQ